MRLDNEPAHQHAGGHQQPVEGQGGDLPSQVRARREKAHVDPREEEGQANVGIQEADDDFPDLLPLQPQGDYLKQAEESGDGEEALEDLHGVLREGGEEQAPQLPAVRRLGHGGGIIGPGGGVNHRQDQHRQDGPHGAQGHQAEAVLSGVLVAPDGGYAQAQGHDEGHGHGARGDAAGVEGHG